MASRLLSDLSPPVRALAAALVRECKVAGIDLLIYCTLRENAEQDELYAQGRTTAGRIVTNARAGQSLHNPDVMGQAWAFDCVPQANGRALWSDAQAIAKVGEIGEKLGLRWAGRWSGALRERVHFELKGGIYGKRGKSMVG